MSILAALLLNSYAGVTSLRSCEYFQSSNGLCSGGRYCTDLCETNDCSNPLVNCDLFRSTLQKTLSMDDFNECFIVGTKDTKVLCADDGNNDHCAGADFCFTTCFLSNTGACNEPCIRVGMVIPGYNSCDDVDLTPYGDQYAFGQCFINGTDFRLECNLDASGSSSNTGMIIGIVVGCLVGIALIVVIVYFMRKKSSL